MVIELKIKRTERRTYSFDVDFVNKKLSSFSTADSISNDDMANS